MIEACATRGLNSPTNLDSARYASASTERAECAQEGKLFVLALSPDVRTRSYRRGATFRGRADRWHWLSRTLDREAGWTFD